jgi:hypothetical protein
MEDRSIRANRMREEGGVTFMERGRAKPEVKPEGGGIPISDGHFGDAAKGR